jgi:transcriptional regulator with XRE-family HTH domain
MLGWSQIDLAEMAGVSVATISSMEAGRAKPSLETMEKIAAAFKCSVDSLMNGGWDSDGQE